MFFIGDYFFRKITKKYCTIDDYYNIYSEQIAQDFLIDHKIESKIDRIEIITSLQSLLVQLHRNVHNSKILKTQISY